MGRSDKVEDTMKFSVEDLGEQARAVLAGLSFSGSDVVLCAELCVSQVACD